MRLDCLSGYVTLGKFLYLSVLICQMGRRISTEAVERGKVDKACERRPSRQYELVFCLLPSQVGPALGP